MKIIGIYYQIVELQMIELYSLQVYVYKSTFMSLHLL